MRPVALETHGLDAHLMWDSHGLSPYWGVVSVFDPDHADSISFEAAGVTWEVAKANYWEGGLAPPDGQEHIDGGMNEYSYKLVADDEVGDRDLTLQLRPGYPDAEHVETGDPIKGMPDDCPKSLRMQAISTNLSADGIRAVVREWAAAVGLNPEYFEGAPHPHSRVTKLERYFRIDRRVSEDRIVGPGGIIDQLALFGSAQSGRGKYRWDHEEVVGHYQSVAADPDTWDRLLESDLGKQLKCYHPAHPRADADTDDPLAHPKVEGRFSNDFDTDGSIPWTDLEAARAEIDELVYHALHWADVDLAPDAGHWIDTDPYFDVVPGEEVALAPNPLPELRETVERRVESELVGANLTSKREDILEVLADGGSKHYQTVADDADAGTSTVYRVVNQFRSLLRTDNGIVQFTDGVVRERVQNILDQVREHVDWGAESIRQLGQDRDVLDGDSALAQWADRHGVRVVEPYPELEFELGRPVSEMQVVKILRAGLDAARASGLRDRFRQSVVSWSTPNGDRRERWDTMRARNGDWWVLGGYRV